MLLDTRKPVTPRQLAVMWHVSNYTEGVGRSPSQDDLARIMDISATAVRHHFVNLRKKGYLTWRRYRGRTVRLIDVRLSCEDGFISMETCNG